MLWYTFYEKPGWKKVTIEILTLVDFSPNYFITKRYLNPKEFSPNFDYTPKDFSSYMDFSPNYFIPRLDFTSEDFTTDFYAQHVTSHFFRLLLRKTNSHETTFAQIWTRQYAILSDFICLYDLFSDINLASFIIWI